MGLRERRLRADALEMERFGGGSIVVLEREGDPPERYRLEYHVKSLAVQNGEVVPRGRHRVEIFLTLAYPRQAPQCRMLTPVFHPNIAPHAICIGDHWTAGESLAALCVRIAEMLSFQSYNLKSPLNGEAAQWTDQNLGRLPLENTDFWKALAGKAEAPGGPGVEAGPPGAAAHGLDRGVPPVPGPPPLFTVPSPPRVLAPPPPVEQIAPPPLPPAAHPPRHGGASDRAEVICQRCAAALSVVKSNGQAWARCPLCGAMNSVP